MPFLDRSTLTYPATNTFPGPRWQDRRDPTSGDFKNFTISTIWINTINQSAWIMVDKTATSGTWIKAATVATGISTITGDAGGAVGPDGANNINLLTGPGLTTTGNPGTNTVTITLDGGGQAIDQVNVDANTAPGTDPVVPTASGEITVTGAQVAAGAVGANVIRTDSLAANTYTIEIQRSTSAAAADSTKNGVSHFDSARFTVDANAFVSLNGAGVGETITGDSGGALSPTAGNWNILGRSGSKTAGAVSTLTVRSPPYADQAGSTTVTLNSGSFATNAITLTTPASAGLADGDLLEFVATNGVLVVQLAATQVAHIGSIATTAAGTITGTATGDSLSLRYQASTNDWWATSVIGVWVLA